MQSDKHTHAHSDTASAACKINEELILSVDGIWLHIAYFTFRLRIHFSLTFFVRFILNNFVFIIFQSIRYDIKEKNIEHCACVLAFNWMPSCSKIVSVFVCVCVFWSGGTLRIRHMTIFLRNMVKIIIINNYHYLSFISRCWRLPCYRLSIKQRQQQQKKRKYDNSTRANVFVAFDARSAKRPVQQYLRYFLVFDAKAHLNHLFLIFICLSLSLSCMRFGLVVGCRLWWHRVVVFYLAFHRIFVAS